MGELIDPVEITVLRTTWMSSLGAYQILIQIVREDGLSGQQTENAKTANSAACDEPAELAVNEDQGDNALEPRRTYYEKST